MQTIEDFQRLAIEEAKLALAKGNMPIGCVVVCDGEVISKGHNFVESNRTDLGHAELNAIRIIENQLFTSKGKCELYCTMEPCLMCYGAIINYRFKRIVYSVSDLYAGYSHAVSLPKYYQSRKIEVISGVLKPEVMELLKAYVTQTGHRGHLMEFLA